MFGAKLTTAFVLATLLLIGSLASSVLFQPTSPAPNIFSKLTLMDEPTLAQASSSQMMNNTISPMVSISSV